MHKKKMIGIAAIFWVLIVAVGVYAIGHDNGFDKWFNGGNFTDKNFTGLHKQDKMFDMKFEMPRDGKFGKGPGPNVNETNFGLSDALKQALEAGNYTQYLNAVNSDNSTYDNRKPMSETEFQTMVTHRQEMEQKMALMNETMQKIEKAIQDNDYDAWKEAVNSTNDGQHLLEKITKDNFGTYVKLQQEMTTVRQLEQELSIRGGFDYHEPIGSPN